ncbi:hypothetical protein F5141DRAFT_1065945 [Pisolithus sp. B1]|nr:hypothetical protein F5141DRAFT_1065945 [Pisolithus sp. B1]
MSAPHSTPITASSTHTSTPGNIITSDSHVEECNSYIHGNDQLEQNASKAMASWCQANPTDITEIISGSKDESSTPPSPFPHSHPKFIFIGSTNAKSEEGKQSWKCSQHSEARCLKWCHHHLSRPRLHPVVLLGLSAVVVASTRSTSRMTFLLAAPLTMPGGDYSSLLSCTLPLDTTTHGPSPEIWDMVYGGNIEHVMIIGGPVFQIVKQSLNNWCGGFATAAVAVIATFFENNADFEDPEEHKAQTLSLQAWSGLWRSLFMLQTFTHHFNYVQGQPEVPVLEVELGGPHAALALSCAVIPPKSTVKWKNSLLSTEKLKASLIGQ